MTAAAALDTGTFNPQSQFDDPGYCTPFGRQVFNYSDQGTPSVVWQGRTLTQAVQNSINSVFCNIGKELGADVVLEYAKRFGFYERPPIEPPPSEEAISGLYRNGRPTTRTTRTRSIPADLRSGRSSPSSRRCRWRSPPRASPTRGSSWSRSSSS